MSVGLCIIELTRKATMNEKSLALQELILATKAELEAEKFNGSTEDENPDPRLIEMMNNLLILEVFYFQDYKNIIKTHFS
jgi:hypothetical protein